MSLRQFEPTSEWTEEDRTLTPRAAALLRGLWDYIGARDGTVPVGSVGGDGTTTKFYRADGTFAVPAYPTGANPTGSIGTAAVNGTAATFLRSDAAPALNLGITPTWTGAHTFSAAPLLSAGAVVAKTSGLGIKVDTASPTFGWRDILGPIEVRGVGAADPTFSIYTGTALRQYEFSATVMKEVFIVFHVPHDYVPGSDVHFHAHWSNAAATPNTGTVIWGFEYTWAKGFDQMAFGATATKTVTQDCPATRYQHMIAESTATTLSGIEVDSLILMRVYRDATVDTCTDSVFLHTCDIHYQSTNLATKGRAPGFYA